MSGDHAIAILTGLAGFLLGGLLAQKFLDFTAVMMVSITIGATAGAAFGALTGGDVTRSGAFGGGMGLIAGVGLGVVDTVWF